MEVLHACLSTSGTLSLVSGVFETKTEAAMHIL